MSGFNLIDVVIGTANADPDRAAFVTDDVEISYGALVARASQCARYLQRHGVTAGQRVAIMFARPEENVVVLLATWMLGATPILLDFRTKSAEKAAVAEALGLSAFVQTRAGAREIACPEIATGDLMDAIGAERAELYERPLASHPAVIFRTSGTTGTPQGVVYSHESLMHMHWAKSRYEMGFQRGLLMHATPLFYSAGLARTLSQLFDGGTSHVLPMITSAEELAERLASSGATVGWMVPPQLLALLELSAGRATPMFPGLRLISGGANIPAEANLRAARELTPDIAMTYGSSLCGAISTLRGEDLPAKAGSVGRPFPVNRLEVFDADGVMCRRGEPGRVRVRSICNADAIIGEARAASDRLVDGWAETGDLGYIDEDGFLYLVGRASDMIIRNGVNVFPREVEAVLDAHEQVVETAVVGVPDDRAGEEIVAFVVVRGDVTEESLHQFARARLVSDKRPTTIRILPAFPRNSSGKIVKRDLVDSLAAERGPAGGEG